MNSIVVQGLPLPVEARIRLSIKQLGSAQAGFPSPAEDMQEKDIDLNEWLIKHPQGTSIIRARGESMAEAGIGNGDYLLVDRAIKPSHMDIVLAQIDGDYTIKYLHQRAGRIKLKAANPTYPDITPREGQVLEIWGVVTTILKFPHQNRR